MTKKKTNLVILVLALLALGLTVALAALLLNGGAKESSGPVSGAVLQEGTVDWKEELPDSSGLQEGIKLPGYGEITVLEQSETLKITLVNPDGNPCYFRYRMELSDTGQVLYESDLIEPGKAIQEIPLDDLPGLGDYSLEIHIDTYSLEDGTTAMNGGVCSTILHVI